MSEPTPHGSLIGLRPAFRRGARTGGLGYFSEGMFQGPFEARRYGKLISGDRRYKTAITASSVICANSHEIDPVILQFGRRLFRHPIEKRGTRRDPTMAPKSMPL